MSISEIIEQECSLCGTLNKVEVWHIINASADPDLKRKLFDFEINVQKCNNCSEQLLLNLPLMYHDVERKICIQYFPREYIIEDGFIDKFDSEGKLQNDKIKGVFEGYYGYEERKYIINPHIVFSLEEMLEYIKFRDRISEKEK
jgi:hypothetical protein